MNPTSLLSLTLFLITIPLPSVASSTDQAPASDPVREIFERFDADTGIEVIVRAAIDTAALDEEGAERAMRRASAGALLPTIRVTVQADSEHDADDALSEVHSPALTRPVGDRGLRLGAELRWDLSAVVDPDRVLKTQREERARLDLRIEIVEHVTALYFERRRLIAEDVLTPGSLKQRIRRVTRIAEIEALLDQLSGGAFTRGR